MPQLLHDHLGSTRTTLDQDGDWDAGRLYYPYGRLRYEQGDAMTDKLFTGHQQEGPLIYMRARFYDPALGRFLSPDSTDSQLASESNPS